MALEGLTEFSSRSLHQCASPVIFMSRQREVSARMADRASCQCDLHVQL